MDTSPKTEVKKDPPKLDYLELPPDFDFERTAQMEGFREKAIRKIKSNPLVPIGLLATTMALTYGLVQMRTGNKVMSQKMMRVRVAAQGFTVIALLGGVLYEAQKKPNQTHVNR